MKRQVNFIAKSKLNLKQVNSNFTKKKSTAKFVYNEDKNQPDDLCTFYTVIAVAVKIHHLPKH